MIPLYNGIIRVMEEEVEIKMNRLTMIVFRNLIRLPWTTIKLFGYAADQNAQTKQSRYELLKYIARQIQMTGNVEIDIFGKENIPKEDGYIFYPNHQGLFDGVAMVAACDTPFSPVIKQELMRIPFVRELFQCLDSMPMDRDDVRQSMKVIQKVAARVKEKENCLIFPEGTRSREGNKLLEFKPGAFKAAVKAKCPIVPVALVDSYKPFDEKGTEPVTMQIHFLEPILYEAYASMNTTQIAEMVKQRIQDTILEYDY